MLVSVLVSSCAVWLIGVCLMFAVVTLAKDSLKLAPSEQLVSALAWPIVLLFFIRKGATRLDAMWTAWRRARARFFAEFRAVQRNRGQGQELEYIDRIGLDVGVERRDGETSERYRRRIWNTVAHVGSPSIGRITELAWDVAPAALQVTAYAERCFVTVRIRFRLWHRILLRARRDRRNVHDIVGPMLAAGVRLKVE